MKRNIITRSFIGALLGIVIGHLISIIISAVYGNGTYFPCVPDLTYAVGTQTGAVIVQTVLDALLGIAFGGASVVWLIDAWSIAKQTLLYLFITLPVMLFAAYFAYWMEHSLKGLLSYTGIFIVIFLFIWLVQYIFWKLRIQKLNEHLGNER